MKNITNGKLSCDAQTTPVRAGLETDTQYGAVTPPIYLSSNYTFEDIDKPRKYDYARSGNPTRDTLGQALADLEGGFNGVVTSTGMSAIYLTTHLLEKGDLILAPHDCYGGTYRLFNSLQEKNLFKVKFVDQGDEDAIRAAIKEDPKMIWIETPSNPLLRVVDIEKLCNLVGDDVLKVVDNTFLSPLLQQPLALGADLVVHSTTKYINGHSDVVGGAVIAKDEQLFEQAAWWANCIGITGSPFDSFLTTRGIRTLGVRVKQHLENTKHIVRFLTESPLIKGVYYPGLESHPTYEIAKRQQQDFGGMLSFRLDLEKCDLRKLVHSLEYFSLAESLGGVESLICHPASMTHAAMAPEARKNAGIDDDLLRISVGIESVEDLISDLKTALAQCQKIDI